MDYEAIREKWQPERGSRLDQALTAAVAAKNAVAEVEAAIERIDERIADAQRVANNVAWDGSNFGDVKQALVDLLALERMREKATAERQRRINEHNVAAQPVEGAVGNLQTYKKRVDRFEEKKRDIPGRITERDRADGERAASTFEKQRAALLVAHD